MSSTFILSKRQDDIVILTLNRPEKLNALSKEMFEELEETLKRKADDDQLRVLILTGSGERAFCAGTDISEITNLTETEAIQISKRGQRLCAQLETFPVPVIAAVNGVAAGGGCELALACHLRLASTTATFSLPEIKLGLIPGYGGTRRLAREVGTGWANEITLTGKTVSAQEAMETGLVNRVVQGDVLEASLCLARLIQDRSPLAIRACLKAVTVGIELSLEDGLALETELFASLFAGEDVREGTRAFLEKREPLFRRTTGKQ